MERLIFTFVAFFSMIPGISAVRIPGSQEQRMVIDAEQAAFERVMHMLADATLTPQACYQEVAALVKQYPSIITMQTPDGWSVLMRAVDYGHTALVKLFLAHGASAQERNIAGWTVLMWAAYHGRTEIVKLLVAHGADPAIQNDKDSNKIARDYARNKVAYAKAVQEGLVEKARRKERQEKDQAAVEKILLEEVTHIAPLVDIMTSYAYDPRNSDDLYSEFANTSKKCGCVVQ